MAEVDLIDIIQISIKIEIIQIIHLLVIKGLVDIIVITLIEAEEDTTIISTNPNKDIHQELIKTVILTDHMVIMDMSIQDLR